MFNLHREIDAIQRIFTSQRQVMLALCTDAQNGMLLFFLLTSSDSGQSPCRWDPQGPER